MLKNYFKIAWRNLWWNKGFSLINIFGLSIGMAASILILLWVQNELKFDSFHEKSDRIFRVTATYTTPEGKTECEGKLPYNFAQNIKEQVPEVDQITQLYVPLIKPVIRIEDQAYVAKRAAFVDEAWFDVFDYEFLMGSPEAVFRDAHSVVLTASRSAQYFGNVNPIGQIIQIDTSLFVVRAIIKDNPIYSSFQYDCLIPMLARSAPEFNDPVYGWAGFFYETFLALRDETSPKTATAKVTDIIKSTGNIANDKYTTSLQPLQKLHFNTQLSKDEFAHTNSETVLLFGVIGILILIIACIDYINLFTLRASMRVKELGIKKAIGASSFHLAGQYIVEAALTGLISLLLAMGLSLLTLPLFSNLVEISLQALIGTRFTYLLLAGIFIIFVLVTGLYPCFSGAVFSLPNFLTSSSITTRNGNTLRQRLVIGQFVVSVILLSGTFVIQQQWNHIKVTLPIDNQETIFSINIPFSELKRTGKNELNNHLNIVERELESRSGFGEVTIASESLLNITESERYGLDWNGRNPNYDPIVNRLIVQQDYNEVFGLQMAQGRWFSKNPAESGHEVILNETAVKSLGIIDPVIGQRFYFPDQDLHEHNGQIVGVVKDFHFKSLHEKITPLIMVNGFSGGKMFVTIDGSAMITDKLAVSEQVWKEFFPKSPFEYQFLQDEFAHLYRSEQQIKSMFSFFSTIAVAIACLGLLGLTAFGVERRVKEIGIRKVLGASISGIVVLISKDFIRMVLIAILIALPIAWYAGDHWLRGYAYRIELQWWMFAIPGLMAVLIAIATVSFQSVKAAMANPVKSLKSE